MCRLLWIFAKRIYVKWRSQNAEKVAHTKGRLLDQAVILFSSFFKIGKEFAPRGSEFFPLRRVPYRMENNFYHIKWPSLNVTIFITHVRSCVIGATPLAYARLYLMVNTHSNSLKPLGPTLNLCFFLLFCDSERLKDEFCLCKTTSRK